MAITLLQRRKGFKFWPGRAEGIPKWWKQLPTSAACVLKLLFENEVNLWSPGPLCCLAGSPAWINFQKAYLHGKISLQIRLQPPPYVSWPAFLLWFALMKLLNALSSLFLHETWKWELGVVHIKGRFTNGLIQFDFMVLVEQNSTIGTIGWSTYFWAMPVSATVAHRNTKQI